MTIFFLSLYNLGIILYKRLLSIAALFNPKAQKWVEGRKDWEQKLRNANLEQAIWFHAPSLGEFEQARPIIESIKKEYPHKKILLSFFSPSGFEIRKNYKYADFVCYLPIDTKKNAETFLNIVSPSLVIWTKYDFWYHFLTKISHKQIPILLISSIFRDRQWFFKFYGQFMQKAIKSFDKIFVQDMASKQLLESIGISNADLVPDTRFDRVWDTAQNPQKIRKLEFFFDKRPVFIVGSMWESDEQVILPFIKQYRDKMQFVIAPHEIHSQKIKALIKKIGGDIECYSDEHTSIKAAADVFILDTIGFLSSAYYYADYAYIGGGFGVGIHNILEAVVFEKMVFFGPNHLKSKEANELVDQKVVFSIRNSKELIDVFEEVCIQSNKNLIKEKLQKYMADNIGSTQIILDFIKQKNWI